MKNSTSEWQATYRLPAFVLGVQCDEAMIFSVKYLPPTATDIKPKNMLSQECIKQIAAYFKSPAGHRFDLPLALAITPFGRRVRAALMTIAPGTVKTYGAIARQIKSGSARAIGAACRANTVALIVPCHRVVAANHLGGFMGDDGKSALNVKRFLLRHEGWHER